MLTPSEVSAKLKIQPSTLRKYSALLEQEGIQFAYPGISRVQIEGDQPPRQAPELD